jgi:hypothetical protein
MLPASGDSLEEALREQRPDGQAEARKEAEGGRHTWAAYLSVLVVLPSITIVASLYLDMDTNRKHNTRLYHRLTASNVKEILEAVAQTFGGCLCNGRLIQARYHELFGKN